MFKSPVDYVAVAMKGSFTKNKSLLRHVRTVHQGMKRTDKKRKSDSHEETAVVNMSTGENREPGAVSRTFGEPVEPNPQAVFKPPAEYVATVIITFTVLHLQFGL